MVDRADKNLMAGSIETNLENLKKLSRDNDRKIRRRVASNSACNQSTLSRLSKDKSFEVRRAVALNPHASYVTLTNLSFDTSPDVRFALAESVRTPTALLRRMCTEDANPYVRKRAKETLDNIETFLEELNNNKNIICHMDHLS